VKSAKTAFLSPRNVGATERRLQDHAGIGRIACIEILVQNGAFAGKEQAALPVKVVTEERRAGTGRQAQLLVELVHELELALGNYDRLVVDTNEQTQEVTVSYSGSDIEVGEILRKPVLDLPVAGRGHERRRAEVVLQVEPVDTQVVVDFMRPGSVINKITPNP
jgi:hypothetical protein